jgi:hypothetical protein
MLVSVRIIAIVFGCCIAFHASATEIFRCTTSSGAVEYRDTSCAAGLSARVEIPDNVVSEIDQTAARKASNAITERANARVRAAAIQNAQASIQEPAPAADSAPDVVSYYVPYYVQRQHRPHRRGARRQAIPPILPPLLVAHKQKHETRK